MLVNGRAEYGGRQPRQTRVSPGSDREQAVVDSSSWIHGIDVWGTRKTMCEKVTFVACLLLTESNLRFVVRSNSAREKKN